MDLPLLNFVQNRELKINRFCATERAKRTAGCMAARRASMCLTVIMMRSGLCAASAELSGFVGLRSNQIAGYGRFQSCIKRPAVGCRWMCAQKNAAMDLAGTGGKPLAVDRLLQQQGFGTRKFCKALVKEVCFFEKTRLHRLLWPRQYASHVSSGEQ